MKEVSDFRGITATTELLLVRRAGRLVHRFDKEVSDAIPLIVSFDRFVVVARLRLDSDLPSLTVTASTRERNPRARSYFLPKTPPEDPKTVLLSILSVRSAGCSSSFTTEHAR